MAKFEINGNDIELKAIGLKKFPYTLSINEDVYVDCTLKQLRTLADGIVAFVNTEIDKEQNVKT